MVLKVRLNFFSTSAGVNLRTKQLEFANSYQYASYYNDLQVNDGGVPTFTEEQLINSEIIQILFISGY